MNMKRIAASVVVLGGVVVILSMISACATVHTETVVDAPREEVWAVLADKEGYKEWNPVLVPLEGELKEGEKVTYEMTGPGDKKSKATSTIVKMVENEHLNQKGGLWGVVTFDHNWILQDEGGKTRVIQHEEYRGVYVPFWDYSWVEPSYAKANENLKARVMSLRGAKQTQ